MYVLGTCVLYEKSSRHLYTFITYHSAQNSILICTIQQLKNMHVWEKKEWMNHTFPIDPIVQLNWVM